MQVAIKVIDKLRFPTKQEEQLKTEVIPRFSTLLTLTLRILTPLLVALSFIYLIVESERCP